MNHNSLMMILLVHHSDECLLNYRLLKYTCCKSSKLYKYINLWCWNTMHAYEFLDFNSFVLSCYAMLETNTIFGP